MNHKINTKVCLVCKVDALTGERKGKQVNECLHWHIDNSSGEIWAYCVGKCQRGYSIYQYVAQAGLKLNEFLKGDFDFKEARPNEVNKMSWPNTFVPLTDPRAQPGLDYLAERGIDPGDGMYYDVYRKGIVFPYFFHGTFCGAQVRLIEPWTDETGDVRKVDTIPGTRLGLLFYGWNQERFLTDIKGLIITEGAFNAIAIQQALNHVYGGILKNPWKAVASSGSGMSGHKIEVLKELKEQGIKIILAPDTDDAGIKMLKKCTANEVITHYAFTDDPKYDWNDVAKVLGKEAFTERFLRSIVSV